MIRSHLSYRTWWFLVWTTNFSWFFHVFCPWWMPPLQASWVGIEISTKFDWKLGLFEFGICEVISLYGLQSYGWKIWVFRKSCTGFIFGWINLLHSILLCHFRQAVENYSYTSRTVLNWEYPIETGIGNIQVAQKLGFYSKHSFWGLFVSAFISCYWKVKYILSRKEDMILILPIEFYAICMEEGIYCSGHVVQSLQNCFIVGGKFMWMKRPRSYWSKRAVSLGPSHGLVDLRGKKVRKQNTLLGMAVDTSWQM